MQDLRLTMKADSTDAMQTRMLSSFLTKMAAKGGYLVCIHPVVLGEGIITLPGTKLTIGRDSDCGLVLDDHDISRRHAEIEFSNGAFTISDLGSTNGILVNNKKVNRATLASGDLIRLGKTILKFLRGNDAEMQYHETVYSMMINDGLTGIPNKRYLLEAFQRELIRSQRHARPLSVAVVDIDFFKAINDKYGHLAGDIVLRELCGRIRAVVRKDEVFARYGGEEFVVLLPESTLDQAGKFAERIRMLISSKPVDVDGTPILVTVSIGLAHTIGEKDVTAEELFKRADQKLYQAKSAGRNRVVW